jgi:hypothetical protein
MAVPEGRTSIRQFISAIRRLPADKPVSDPRKWYTTQKEHWLRWLRDYHRSGAYGRKTGKNRDAQYAYNHIVEPKMLLWLVAAARVNPDLVHAASRASNRAATMPGKSASIRKHVPWSEVAAALWGSRRATRPRQVD